MSTKRCTTCGEVKPLDQFHRQPNAPDGRKYTCKPCTQVYSARKYQESKERLKATRAAWYEVNKAVVARKRKKQHDERVIRVLRAYGGRCVCCGEKNLGFLTLDHVNGDGAEHRRRMRSNLYRWAEANGYPDVLQVQCWNCNVGRYHNGGVCPHGDQGCLTY